jgi:U4/U6.U5 tri-snRNP component SNU23
MSGSKVAKFYLLDLRALGQTTRIERSSVEQVRARIAYLREKTKEASAAKAYDFDRRLSEIRDKELAVRAAKKAERKAVKEKTRIELAQSTAMDVDSENMMAAMGFAGFGTSKK